MNDYNLPNSFMEETMMQINKLQKELKFEKRILERFSIRLLIFMLEVRISRTKRIAIDIIVSTAAFYVLIYAPLGFILNVIVLHLCMHMEGIYSELFFLNI